MSMLKSSEATRTLQNISLQCFNIRLPHLVADVSCDIQVPLTANHSLVKPPQHL